MNLITHYEGRMQIFGDPVLSDEIIQKRLSKLKKYVGDDSTIDLSISTKKNNMFESIIHIKGIDGDIHAYGKGYSEAEALNDAVFNVSRQLLKNKGKKGPKKYTIKRMNVDESMLDAYALSYEKGMQKNVRPKYYSSMVTYYNDYMYTLKEIEVLEERRNLLYSFIDKDELTYEETILLEDSIAELQNEENNLIEQLKNTAQNDEKYRSLVYSLERTVNHLNLLTSLINNNVDNARLVNSITEIEDMLEEKYDKVQIFEHDKKANKYINKVIGEEYTLAKLKK